ncbi:MAG: DUF2530 domain-containing protein [Candidatus Nanopelagicales bacterium]|jgi:hypothetical protein
MSRTSAYRAEPGSVASAQVAVRVGTVCWLAAAVVGSVVIERNDGELSDWLMMCAIGTISGLLGLVFLRRKARGN